MGRELICGSVERALIHSQKRPTIIGIPEVGRELICVSVLAHHFEEPELFPDHLERNQMVPFTPHASKVGSILTLKCHVQPSQEVDRSDLFERLQRALSQVFVLFVF